MRLVQSIGNGIHSAAACPECKVREEWNEALRQENAYLKSLLLEPKVEINEAVKLENYSPIGGVSTWKSLRNKLERKAVERKVKNENPEIES
jgi:hypothetical protein